jgi:hypothetical protein
VTIAVYDLTQAIATFEEGLGFSTKPGTVHGNGLRNAHVRFRDDSALELMSVEGGIPDALSDLYRSFLADGEGGAFVALAAGPIDSVLVRLGERLEGASVSRGPAVDWIAFPVGHDLHPVFLVDVRSRAPDAPAQREHANGALGIAQVRLQLRDPESLERLLAPLGARACGSWTDRTGVPVTGLGLRGGTLVAVPLENGAKRGRIASVTLKGGERQDPVRAGGVRLEWEVGGG